MPLSQLGSAVFWHLRQSLVPSLACFLLQLLALSPLWVFDAQGGLLTVFYLIGVCGLAAVALLASLLAKAEGRLWWCWRRSAIGPCLIAAALAGLLVMSIAFLRGPISMLTGAWIDFADLDESRNRLALTALALPFGLALFKGIARWYRRKRGGGLALLLPLPPLAGLILALLSTLDDQRGLFVWLRDLSRWMREVWPDLTAVEVITGSTGLALLWTLALMLLGSLLLAWLGWLGRIAPGEPLPLTMWRRGEADQTLPEVFA